MASTQPSHDAELEAVEQALTRLALTNDPKAFTNLISAFLPAFFLSLSTNSPAAIKKILDALKHIKIRLRADESIKLPLASLIKLLYQGLPSASPESGELAEISLMARNFILTGGFLEMGLRRDSPENNILLLPDLVRGCHLLTEKQNQAVLLLAFLIIANYVNQKDADKQSNERESVLRIYELLANEFSLQSYASLITNKLMQTQTQSEKRDTTKATPPPRSPSLASDSEKMAEIKEKGQDTEGMQNSKQLFIRNYFTSADSASPPTSLHSFLQFSLQAISRNTEKEILDSTLLPLLNLLSLFTPSELIAPHLLAAYADQKNNRLSSLGERLMKQVVDINMWENQYLVKNLVQIYLNTKVDDNHNSLANMKHVLLTKVFTRSLYVANYFPHNIKIMFDAIFTGSSIKLKEVGIEFASWMIRSASKGNLKTYGQIILSGLLKVTRSYNPNQPNHTTSLSVPQTQTQAQVQRPNTTDPQSNGVQQNQGSETTEKMCSLAYNAISHTSNYCSFLIENDLALPKELFESLLSSKLSNSLKSSVVQCLSSLCLSFAPKSNQLINAKEYDDLMALLWKLYFLLSDQDSDDSLSKSVVLKWVNTCFPFHDAKARLLNIALTGDQRQDIHQLALSGLDPTEFERKWRLNDNTSKSATQVEKIKFPELTCFIESFRNIISGATFETKLTLNNSNWLYFYLFSLRLLSSFSEHNGSQIPNQEFLDSLSELEDYAYFHAFREDVDLNMETRNFADTYRLEQAVLAVILFSSKYLNEKVSAQFFDRVDTLITYCSNRCATGTFANMNSLAYLIALASSKWDEQRTRTYAEKFSTILVSPGMDKGQLASKKASCILVIGFVMRYFMIDEKEIQLQIFNDLFVKAMEVYMSATNEVIVQTSLQVLALLGVLRPLPLDAGDFSEKEPSLESETTQNILKKPRMEEVKEQVAISTQVIVQKLISFIEDEKSPAKLVESSCTALGSICIGDSRRRLVQLALNTYLKLAKLRKEDEIHFTAGENIVGASSGIIISTVSPQLNSEKNQRISVDEELKMLTPDYMNQVTKMPFFNDDWEDFETLIQEMSKLCQDPKPHTRAAGCIYLFNLIKYAGNENIIADSAVTSPEKFFRAQVEVKANMSGIQRAFSLLLNDKADFVQQLASKGLSLAYKQSDSESRKEMVSALVRSLTSGKGKAAATSVAGDEGGILEIEGLKTESGSNTATYKELCSICNDMGKPELIYRFMDLAGHAAVWNSRRGAALAGEALLYSDEAAEELKKYLPDLLPKLYLFSYDPADGMRMAMNKMLASICRAAGYNSTIAAITEYYDTVISHVLKSMGSRQWRIRESAAAALRDSLSSRKFEEVENYLEEAWNMTFRALDDIKETVRTTAGGCARNLSALSIRLCDPHDSSKKNAERACQLVVPKILGSITHHVKEIQAISVETLSQIIKKGGKSLTPMIPDIIGSLLESATELEPAVLNYAQFHVEEKDQLEALRARAATLSSTPIIDSLEKLVTLVNEDIMADLISQILRISRTGVGLPTKAACSRIVGSLVINQPTLVKPYCGKLMNVSVKAALQEKSVALQTTWAYAAGNAARLARSSTVSKNIKELIEKAMGESSRERLGAGILLHALVQKAPETARDHATLIAPIAYISQFSGEDATSDASEVWKETWSDIVPSTAAGLRLYHAEITVLACKMLEESPQYAVKRNAALAIEDFAINFKKSGTAMSFPFESYAQCYNSLLRALPGRLWDGKEAIHKAMGALADSMYQEYGGTERYEKIILDRDAMISTLSKECFRGKRSYRTSGIACYSKYLRLYQNIVAGLFEDVRTTIVEPLLKELEEAELNGAESPTLVASNDEEVDAKLQMRKERKVLYIKLLECLEKAFPGKCFLESQVSCAEDYLQILEKASREDADVRLQSIDSLNNWLSLVGEAVFNENTVGLTGRIIGHCLSDSKFLKNRRSGVQAMKKLVLLYDKKKIGGILEESLRLKLKEMSKQETDSSIKDEVGEICRTLGL